MTVICSKRLSSRAFHYNPETKTFTAEISELSRGGTADPFGRVYDDAADEGFVIVSSKTGDEVTFVINGADRDSDGDIAGWVLVPINRKSGYRDCSKDFSVLVIND